MSDIRLLFIVVGDRIIVGKAMFHKYLADRCEIPRDTIIGGGEFKLSDDLSTVILFGESFDFGAVTEESLLDIIETEDFYEYDKRQMIPKFKFEVGYTMGIR